MIIPVFNRLEMAIEAVQSALSQTFDSIEVLIIDDGSEEYVSRSLSELTSSRPSRLNLIRQQNAGPGSARNTGLAAAKGEFIQYLDSDDLLASRKLEKQVDALRRHSAADVAYCITERKDPESGMMKPWARTDELIEDLFPSFLPKRGWATLTPLWRRSVCDRIGPWADFRVLEDWDHDLRAGMLGVKPVWVPEVLCTVRDHYGARASGMKSGFTLELTREFFRAHESVWDHMKRAGLTDWSYVQRFSRTMFWIARMCGGYGLIEQAELALRYTDEMTQLNKQPSATKGFRIARRAVGWKVATSVAEGAHKLMSTQT